MSHHIVEAVARVGTDFEFVVPELAAGGTAATNAADATAAAQGDSATGGGDADGEKVPTVTLSLTDYVARLVKHETDPEIRTLLQSIHGPPAATEPP